MVRPILRYVIAVGGIVLLVGSVFAIAPQIWPPDLRSNQIGRAHV